MIQHTSWNDTIVAIATPPGIGAIGVIRVSGSQAFQIVEQLFASKKLSQQASHTIHVGLLKNDDEVLDEVVISIFKGPRSYTGEDVIEISCHGSPFIHQQIINALISKGGRLAKAGEFTQRAFLNGKKDLAQAEAVADIIASNTEASLRAAMHTMRGGFSSHLKSLREQLIMFSALIELELDFSQEDVEFADRTAFHQLIDELISSTTMLATSFQLGNVIKNGVSVAIVGKPNAGKSTLLNALLNENRAIVSEIPGTTRDTIEEVLNIDGILFRLIDTAGIRNDTEDLIESAGIERSREKMKQADLVIYLFDANDEVKELAEAIEEIGKVAGKYLIVVNKIDNLGDSEARDKFVSFEKIIFISAKQQLHLEVLKERMTDMVLDGRMQWENTVITNARHYHALNEASISLKEVKDGLNNRLPGDLLALDIRRSLQYLGEITGEVSNEDMLDYIFSKFCIGK